MNCYCYETDSAFIFCVEEAENAQLEQIIQHKAWIKTDDKFLMMFPHNVFSNQREKENIGGNFERLGQALFESSLTGIEWEKPLDMLINKLNENGIEWYIVGSVCDTLRGIDVKPSDIDIVIHTKDYYKAKDICYQNFSDFIIAPFMANQNPEYFITPLKYFGRMFIAGAMIEIASDESWNSENRNYEKIIWHDHNLYLESFQHRYQIEKLRNREDRIKAFEKHINISK